MDNEITRQIRVYGIVQGVGFRPTVSRHAMAWKVRGSVSNKGPYVEIFAQGNKESVEGFTRDIEEKPPKRAAILKLMWEAVEDAPVYAAADGQVLSITQDACTGTTVTMELGNGYQAVYGQLKDLTVAEGDTVKEGEVIGNISAPTKYYSVEGPNLYFAMRKDGTPVDPFEDLE